MNKYLKKIKEQTAAVALVLVVMITTLTLVSAVVIALINISNLTANYHISEATKVQAQIDSCVNEALYRIASSSDVKLNYTFNVSTTACTFEIATAQAGIKTVTVRATSTGDLGAWFKGVTVDVNASQTPIMIYNYKDIIN